MIKKEDKDSRIDLPNYGSVSQSMHKFDKRRQSCEFVDEVDIEDVLYQPGPKISDKLDMQEKVSSIIKSERAGLHTLDQRLKQV